MPRIELAVREILLAVGEDPERDGLKKTPRRFAKAIAEMFAGLRDDASRHLQTRFVQDSDEAVLVSDIDFSSTCEHHLLPFFGKAHVAYLPAEGQVVGLSKLARTIDTYARRPQLQERLVKQIADAFESHLEPRGVCVVLQAEHLCMRLRGVCKPGAITTTTAFRGVYCTSRRARSEVLSLLMGKRMLG